MQPTLLVLAAGMGSRYGGLKQMDGFGPGGETLLEYSIFDARRAGFNKVVLVIRTDLEELFREKVLARFAGQIETELVFQDADPLLQRDDINPERTRPWGTGHAVLCAREAIDAPFAVINADDYYGPESYARLAAHLGNADAGQWALVGYRLERTLSEYGTVSRAICATDGEGLLQGLTEHTKIGRAEDGRILSTGGEAEVELPIEAPTSINLFGFTPDIMSALAGQFSSFIEAHKAELKAEYFLPFAVNDAIAVGQATVRVLDTPERWFGVTYADDRPLVEAALRERIASGVYPERLWG